MNRRSALKFLGTAPIRPAAPAQPGSASTLTLPEAHRQVLAQWGSVVTLDGMVRLRGLCDVGRLESIAQWNVESAWKFAWPNELALNDFLCFGENAFGHQFAYRHSDLVVTRPPVYWLYPHTMRAERLASDFDEFIEVFFLLDILDPDEYVLQARGLFAPLDPGHQVALSPPPIVQDVEHPSMHLMPSRDRMTTAGDLFTQARHNSGRRVSGLSPYFDDSGRARMRLDFARDGE